jgi:TRAP-type C4-dicarboxylate transport system substrate-binding protein
MHLLIKQLSVLICLILLVFTTPVKAAPPALRVASFISPLSPQNAKVIAPWIQNLKKLSDNELDVDFYPGGSLGRHGDYQLKLLLDGVHDVSLIVPGYTPGRFPDNNIFELPLLMNSSLEASLAYYRMIKNGYLRGYEDTKLISVFMSQPYFIHLNTPYQSLDDLKGKKIRVAGYLQAEIIRRLGGTPIGGTPVTQIRESISRGLIDGTLLGWDSMHIFGVKHVTHYHIEIPVTYTPILLLMNLASYESLDSKHRTLIDLSSGEEMVNQFSTATTALALKTYEETLDQDGQHFITPDEDELSRWHEALSPIEQSWINQNPSGRWRIKGLNEILTAVRRELNTDNKS